MTLPIAEELRSGPVKLALLNTLHPGKAQEYAKRSTPWINDPEINQYLSTQSTSIEKSIAWYQRKPTEIETDRTFAIWVSGIHVGNCGLHSIDRENGHAELGIVIGESQHHSQGIGGHAIQALCKHALEDLGLRKVFLYVLGNNHRGIRCYEKCGFKEVGRFKSHTKRNGEFHDYLTMEVFLE